MKKVICLLIFIASVFLADSVPIYAGEQAVKETEIISEIETNEDIPEISARDITKNIKFSSVDNASKIEEVYASATGNGRYICLVVSDKGEEVYYATGKKSFRQLDLAAIVKKNFGLSENAEVSIDDVIYDNKSFYLSGSYCESTGEDNAKYRKIFVASTKNFEKFNFYYIGEALDTSDGINNDDGLEYSMGYTYIEKIDGNFYICLDMHLDAVYPESEEIPDSYSYDIDCINGYYGKTLKKMKPIRLHGSIDVEAKNLNCIGMICSIDHVDDKLRQTVSVYPNKEYIGATYVMTSKDGKKWSRLKKKVNTYYEVAVRNTKIGVEYTDDGQKVKSVSEKEKTVFETVIPTKEVIVDWTFLVKENEENGLYISEMLLDFENESYRIFGDGRLEKVKIPFSIEDGKNHMAYKNDLSFITSEGYIYLTKTNFDELARIKMPCSEDEFIDIEVMGNYLIILSEGKTYKVKISKIAACLQ